MSVKGDASLVLELPIIRDPVLFFHTQKILKNSKNGHTQLKSDIAAMRMLDYLSASKGFCTRSEEIQCKSSRILLAISLLMILAFAIRTWILL